MGDFGIFSGPALAAATEGAGAATAGEAFGGALAEDAFASELASAATATAADVAPGLAGITSTIIPDVAAGSGILGELGSLYNTVSPFLNTAQSVLSGVNALKSAFSGGPGQAQIMGAPSPAPLATSSAPSGISPDDYQSQEKARWQQFFAGTGQGLPGDQLPQDITDMIARQAALIK